MLYGSQIIESTNKLMFFRRNQFEQINSGRNLYKNVNNNKPK